MEKNISNHPESGVSIIIYINFHRFLGQFVVFCVFICVISEFYWILFREYDHR